MRMLGVDLAWKDGSDGKAANETGVLALEPSGEIVAAGWTIGLEQTFDWIGRWSEEETSAFVDAPLVVSNPPGTQRLCEREVGRRYMHPWKVAANSSNVATKALGGVVLRMRMEEAGWTYEDGLGSGEGARRSISECYPYTTIVGVPELGYGVRPLYKRKPRKLATADWRPVRAAACDELIGRVAGLSAFDPPIDLRSHDVTRRLVEEPSPLEDRPYKSREDLLDAAICAWTAAYWRRHGRSRCAILGADDPLDQEGLRATIIAPWWNFEATSSLGHGPGFVTQIHPKQPETTGM
jgi:predicted RNase H-like nuclease